MTCRRPLPLLAVCAVSLLGAALIGCTPAPEPTPTPTQLFASEEEAFAAAEATYRAYNDAGNARRLGEASPDPQDFLVGKALEDDIDGGQYLASEGLRTEGEITILSVSLDHASLGELDAEVTLIVCVDASKVSVIDSTGANVTPNERSDRFGLRARMVDVDGDLRIADEAPETEGSC